jgi:hypothetical protein
MIIPNTVIGGAGAMPPLGNVMSKYISLCSESAFDLVTFANNITFNNYNSQSVNNYSCQNNIMMK